MRDRQTDTSRRRGAALSAVVSLLSAALVVGCGAGESGPSAWCDELLTAADLPFDVRHRHGEVIDGGGLQCAHASGKLHYSVLRVFRLPDAEQARRFIENLHVDEASNSQVDGTSLATAVFGDIALDLTTLVLDEAPGSLDGLALIQLVASRLGELGDVDELVVTVTSSVPTSAPPIARAFSMLADDGCYVLTGPAGPADRFCIPASLGEGPLVLLGSVSRGDVAASVFLAFDGYEVVEIEDGVGHLLDDLGDGVFLVQVDAAGDVPIVRLRSEEGDLRCSLVWHGPRCAAV